MIQILAPVQLLIAVFIGSGHAAERPNILFILTDDQAWPTLGCYGGEHVPTPNLDRLAAEGVRFTDAYVMPQCTPTRAALLTGQHTARNGMWHVIGRWYGYPWAPVLEPMFVQNLPREAFTLAKGLRDAGYATACLGKWHLTQNDDGGYLNLAPAAAHHFGFDWVPEPPSRDYARTGDKGVDWLTEQTIEFISRHRDRPWFAYLAHHTIHGPVVAPAELVAEYRTRGAPETGMFNATYLAALKHLDRSVGRLRAALDRLELADNTLIVFLSDNGGIDTRYELPGEIDDPVADVQLQISIEEYDNAPLRAGKGSAYEGGIRVPCLVRWPGMVEAGRVCQTPIHVVDWLPTLLSVAGADAPPDYPIDGADLTPLLRGESIPERDLFWYMPLYDLRWAATPCAVIRSGDWKLIEYFGDHFDAAQRYHRSPHLELFNLDADTGEQTNLAGMDPHRAAALQHRLHEWIESLEAEIPVANPHHDPVRVLIETRERQPWNR